MAKNTTIQLPFTTSHAFIIGINDYEHVSPLSTAINDASKIAEQLADQHQFQVHPPLLNATHEDMQKLLSETIPKLVKEDDRILFYFAGHGIALDGEEGPNGYLVAADTRPGQEQTLIPMMDLHDALTTLPCRHGLLILDCCFSGAFKWSSGYRDVVFDMPKVIYEERFWRYCKDPAWQVITSAAHDQKAVDIITNQSLGLRDEAIGEHSPFALSLMKALDGAGDVIPAGRGDGVITATELYSYLRDSVETQTTENAKRQSPSIFNLQRHDKGEFIFLHPNHRFNLPPTPDRNPFMGLSSYNEADSNLFYGRDRVVTALLDKVKQQPLIVVSGASGTGKSSVIKAGVLPNLRLQGYAILPIIRPGKEPMQTIATELPDISTQLTKGKTVLVIDQYEELITQCLHEAERINFEQQIADWLKQYSDLRILISIRSDFEPQFESETLAQWWTAGRYVVPSFSLEEIREIITKPAAQAVLFYEPEDLVEQLSEEVSQAPGALPLLSFTLSELYHKYLKSGREDRGLTEADYLELGGVIGALRTRADAEYEALSRAQQSSMRKLMLRMVSLEGGELAGKRVYAKELQFSYAAETTRLQSIANQLVDARLLLKGTDGQGRTYVEPAHDALVRAWGRLWEWIKAVGEEKISLQYKLSQAVNDYHGLLATDSKKARNLLWNSNPRLDLLRAELEGSDHNFNAQEEEFVRESVKRRTSRQRTNWSIAFAVMIGLAGLALVAYYQGLSAEENAQLAQDSASEAIQERDRANEEATKAIANGLASRSLLAEQTDPTVALRIAELALEYGPHNTNALGALLTAYYREDAPLLDYFYTLDAEYPAVPDNTSVSRNLNTLASSLHPEVGQYIDRVREWDQQAGNTPYTVSPNAQHFLMVMPATEVLHNPVIILINKSCPELSMPKRDFIPCNNYPLDHRGSRNEGLRYYPRAFSQNNRRLLTPNGNRVDILDIKPDCQLEFSAAASGPGSFIWAVFNSSEDRIIARTRAGTNCAWSLQNEITPLLAYNASARPDIPTLADTFSNFRRVFCDTTGSDFVFIWEEYDFNSEEGTIERRTVEGNTISTPSGESLEFSKDQLTLTSGGRVVADLNDYIELFNNDQPFLQVASSVGRYTIQLIAGHSVKITDQETQRKVVLDGHRKKPQSVSFDPAGQFIVTSSDGEIRFWDWRGYNFYAMDFGGLTQLLPDGKTLCLWRLERGKSVFQIMLLDIDPSSILQKINARDVFQLTPEDKLRYGIDQ